MLEFLKLIFGPALGGIGKISETFFGSKLQRDTAQASEQQAVLAQFAAEFADRANRTWWDSFVDGLNRLPRPVFAFSVFGLLIYAPIDPVQFAVIMKAYEVVPEWVAIIWAQVIFLYFGGRMLAQSGFSFKGSSTKRITEFIKELKSLQEVIPISKDDFIEEMADVTKPLSNKAIEEWNRRRKGE